MIDTSLFCKRLKEQRKNLGLNQSEMAEICGVKRETWSRYETGALTPGMEVLAALASVGADVQYILTGVRSGAAVPPHEEGDGVYVTDPRKLALLDNYEGCSEEDRRALEKSALLHAKAKHREVKEDRRKAG